MAKSSRLGKWVRELREKRGLTQAALAKRTGVDERTIRRIENGEKARFSHATLKFVAEALKVDPHELERLSEEEPSAQAGGEELISIKTGREFFAILTAAQSYRVHAADATEPVERDLVTALLDAIETAEIWDSLTPGQRYEEEQGVSEIVGSLIGRSWFVVAARRTGTLVLPDLPQLASATQRSIPNWVEIKLIVARNTFESRPTKRPKVASSSPNKRAAPTYH